MQHMKASHTLKSSGGGSDWPTKISRQHTLNVLYPKSKMSILSKNKTNEDGGITIDFWIIKVHISN